MNFREKTATVAMKKDKIVSRADIEGALGKAGYGVTSFKELSAGGEQEPRKQGRN